MYVRHTVRLVAVAALVACGLPMLIAPAASAAGANPAAVCQAASGGTSVDCTVTYSYTGTEATFTVPSGVDSLSVVLVGADGGDNGWNVPSCGCLEAKGGAGATVTGVLTVTPDQLLYVEVGGSGGTSGAGVAGFNGGGEPGGDAGGGGGATDIRTTTRGVTPLDNDESLPDRLAVAAGGGGAGLQGDGGSAGEPGQGPDGGGAGGLSQGGLHGFGGGTDGFSGVGGGALSGDGDSGGGGGGGGLYGGGSGGIVSGGGGGSSLVPTGWSESINAGDTGTGNGSATIRYAEPVTSLALSSSLVKTPVLSAVTLPVLGSDADGDEVDVGTDAWVTVVGVSPLGTDPSDLSCTRATCTAAGPGIYHLVVTVGSLYAKVDLEASRLGQSISFSESSFTLGQEVSLSGQTSSGLTVSYAVTSGPCTLSGSTLTATAAGSCVVQATQRGSKVYGPAPPVTATFTVGPATPVVTLSADPADPTFGTAITVSAQVQGISGGPAPTGTVGFVVDGTAVCPAAVLRPVTPTPAPPAAVAQCVLRPAAGQQTVTAEFETDGNYQSASGVESVDVAQAAQSVVFTSAAPTDALAGGSYTPAATGGGSGEPVVFSVDPASTVGACRVADGAVTFTGTGSCVIDANQAGSADYLAAVAAQQAIAVSAGVVTIGTVNLPEATVGQSYSANLSASGGLVPYSWSATGLPRGLVLNSATGVISGTPKVTGDATVVVTVTDSEDPVSATASLPLEVLAAHVTTATTTPRESPTTSSTTTTTSESMSTESSTATSVPAGTTRSSTGSASTGASSTSTSNSTGSTTGTPSSKATSAAVTATVSLASTGVAIGSKTLVAPLALALGACLLLLARRGSGRYFPR